MAELGVSTRELARRLRTSHASVSRFLTGAQESSRIAHRIATELGLPLPHMDVTDVMDARWLQHGTEMRELDPAAFAELVVLIEQRDHLPAADVGRRVALLINQMRSRGKTNQK